MGEYAAPMATFSLGAFNGEGQNIGANRDSSLLFVGRLSVRPLPQATLAGHVARYSPDSLRYGADLTLEQSGALARFEALGQHQRYRARDDFGWYAMAMLRVLPWLQCAGKLEDFQRPALGQQRRISALTLDAILEIPGGHTRIMVGMSRRRTGYPRVRRSSVFTQVQLRF